MKLSLTRETKDVRGSMKSRMTTIAGAAPDMRGGAGAALHPPRRLCRLCRERCMRQWGGGPAYEMESVPAWAPLPAGAQSLVFHQHWDWVTALLPQS